MSFSSPPPKRLLCVPNFSEGRRESVIQAVREAAQACGVWIHHLSWDPDHHRMVLAFSGSPSQVRKAVLATGAIAVAQIDLTQHTGVHPRIGAMDVVPFVPLQGITLAEALRFARRVARAFARQHGVPVYLYEHSAAPGRIRDLPTLRRGGFEAWVGKPLRGERRPDFGPARLHPTAGATIMGVRDPLIAFNVNLATDQVEVAKEIARRIRRERDRNPALIGVRALGLFLASRRLAQVSLNLTRPDQTDPYQVLRYVEEQAQALGVPIANTELIGVLLTPQVAPLLNTLLKTALEPEQIVTASSLPAEEA